jgi:hypothetical protein
LTAGEYASITEANYAHIAASNSTEKYYDGLMKIFSELAANG